MNKKGMSYLALAIGFGLMNVIVFAVPTLKTVTFWIAYGFSVVAFGLQIGIWQFAFSHGGSLKSKALGIPVVSTDCPCGGPATLIEDGVNGLLVPVGDAFALSDAFRKILSDAEFAEKLGENAYNITKELNPDKVNGEWKKYLTQIAKKERI